MKNLMKEMKIDTKHVQIKEKEKERKTEWNEIFKKNNERIQLTKEKSEIIFLKTQWSSIVIHYVNLSQLIVCDFFAFFYFSKYFSHCNLIFTPD